MGLMLTLSKAGEARDGRGLTEGGCPRTQRLMRHLWQPIFATALGEQDEVDRREYRSWFLPQSPVEYVRTR